MNHASITSGLAIAHLYRRFPPPEFFSAHEVTLSGVESDVPGPVQGWRGERRADFVTLRLWGGASHLRGFEVKVSRSDFLAELKSPEKRAPMESVCACCYFVAPRGVLDMAELPEGWGWFELTAAGLRLRRESSMRRRPLPPAAYHALFKRIHDLRWYDRARKPALLDWPKEVFSFAGETVTPGKLEALAQQVFFKAADSLRLEGRAAARAEMSERLNTAEALSTRYGRALGRLLGLSAWDLEALTPTALDALADRVASGSAAPRASARRSLDAADQALQRASTHLAKLKADLGLP